MRTKNNKISHTAHKSKAEILTWLLTLVYFGSYITRQNFNVMLLYVIDDFSKSSGILPTDLKVSLSIVFTAMTITYGAGQVICGFLGDKIKPQYMISTGLILAVLTNILMANSDISSSDGIWFMVIVWAINGFAHSMLWPPIVRIMSVHLTDVEYSRAAVRVSCGSQIATVLLYLGCPLLISTAKLEWRWVMLICAIIGILIFTVWSFLSPALLRSPLKENKPLEKATENRIPLPKFVIAPLICIFFGIIFQGIMRDGVTNWTPTLLDETFHLGDAISTVSAVVLAIFSMVSFSIYEYIHRKIFKNEVFCAAMIFGVSAILSVPVLLMLIFEVNNPIISVMLMALIVGNMHGINLMLITVVPKRFVKSGKVSLFSGTLNACTYVGASIGNTVFAWLSGFGMGWTPVVISWIVVSTLGLIFCLIATPLWKKFRNTYADV